jgi:hypothetical protein
MAHRTIRLAALSLIVGACLTIGAAAPALASPAITSVTFHGSSAGPQVVIQGSGFGNSKPGSYPPGGCPTRGTGRVYGTSLYIKDRTAQWEAGHGGPGLNTNCIGLVVTQWTSTSVTFSFGSSYASEPNWFLSPGDGFKLVIRGVTAKGTVSYT